jgi:TolB-like protein/Tfp pilus assembly protein PilF
MAGFFKEIKRRKVYRVAAAYAVVAGGAIQLASAVFPAWDLPAWALRSLIIVLLIGFPISLILAWALEVNPEGIRTTPNAPSAPRRRRNVLALVVIGVIVSAGAGIFLLPRASARKIDKSIAVLPFENFSDDKENAYFADGIQDDILTNLSKIGDLKVISRTSVMPYRGKEKNVKEIGKALGVSAILEGSVRKDSNSNRVRVNVQLINAETDQHLWSEVYDRDLTDVFAIQTDLAKKIADELHAKLSPAEKALMNRKPTENGEAYLAFVQGHNLHANLEDITKLRQAEQLYERALKLDPNFAVAAAQLSKLESWIYHTYEPTVEHRQKSRTLAERALQLQPDLPEAHLALGFSFYYLERDYVRALQEFGLAQQGLPNDPEVYVAIGAIQRRQGKWAESNANLEKAATLSPNETWPLQNVILNYQMQRNFAAANKALDHALKLAPDSLNLRSIKSQVEIADKGSFEYVEQGIRIMDAKEMSEQDRSHFTVMCMQVLLLQRKYEEVLRRGATLKDEFLAPDYEMLLGKYGAIGIARKMSGDEAGSREVLLKAKEIAEKYVSQAPEDFKRHGRLAEMLAWLGENGAAIAEAKRGGELLPESVDAFDGPVATQNLAETYATVGEPDQAIALLDHLLSVPSPVTVTLLKIHPIWDPIRNDPRFIALLTKHGG